MGKGVWTLKEDGGVRWWGGGFTNVCHDVNTFGSLRAGKSRT